MLSFVAFAILSFALILCAVMMMATDNILHAAFWFLGAALTVAALFWFLGTEYLAAVQLLVYGGAVGILLVFALLATKREQGQLYHPIDASLSAFILALIVLAIIVYAVLASPTMMRVADPVSPPLAEFGQRMFSMDGWVLPFEVVSLVLTVALVAAVWWTRGDRPRRGGRD